jgi:class 3 adenylate cyclase
LLAHLSLDPAEIDDCFVLPSVVVFAGCESECTEPTSAVEHALRRAIRERLEHLGAGFGYSSLQGLSELIFIEELTALGGEVHIVMPLAPNAFRKNLGALATDKDYVQRYHRALARAAQVQGITELAEADSVTFRNYTQLVLDGLGRLHRDALETPLAVMALSRNGHPLVSDVLAGRWGEAGEQIERIELDDTQARDKVAPRTHPERENRAIDKPYPHQVMVLLFADVVGYSSIPEQEIPLFVQHFLGAVAALDARSSHRPIQKNTWGDALYFVFEHIGDSALFALELSEMVATTDWWEKGISTPLDLRIALHAGPVYACDDPIVQRRSFCGSHVNWAARIEPITPPGQVYASQPFAALVKAQDVSSVRCEYVGQVPLAKRYGDFPLYHVQPGRAARPA